MTCFGRDNDCTRLWAQFAKGRNVLMLAPRRIGKTVLLNRLRDEGERMGYRAIVLDVQGFREEKAFFQQMCAVIQGELGAGATLMTAFTDKLRQAIRGTEASDWRQLLLHTDWREFANHLLDYLNNDKAGKPWVVLLDEIPIFALALLEAHGAERIHDFLYTIRQFRHAYPRVLWLFTGSIGMDTITRRHSIEGALNDLEAYTLKPFDEPTATAFLLKVSGDAGLKMSQEAARQILRRLGWLSPYYLEKIAEDAGALVPASGVIEIDHANRALEAMLGLDKRTYWSSWREHLQRNFPDPERTHLFTILATIARSHDGTASRDTLLGTLSGGEPMGENLLSAYLDTLEADGYLAACEDDSRRYHFRMGMLREWWLRYVAP